MIRKPVFGDFVKNYKINMERSDEEMLDFKNLTDSILYRKLVNVWQRLWRFTVRAFVTASATSRSCKNRRAICILQVEKRSRDRRPLCHNFLRFVEIARETFHKR